MPDVEVGLGAVLGDEDLTVLERAHGARVHVEVGIQLLHHDVQTARRKEIPEARSRKTLAERGDHTSGDEDVLGRA